MFSSNPNDKGAGIVNYNLPKMRQPKILMKTYGMDSYKRRKRHQKST